MTEREIEAKRKEIKEANAHRRAGLKGCIYAIPERAESARRRPVCIEMAWKDGASRRQKKSVGQVDFGILWDITFDFWKNRGQNEMLYVIY